MKVGDYVRNKYGIAKVIDIENNNGIDILVFDKPICFLVNKETGKIKDDRLLNRLAIIDGVDISKIKSSPNIIDLIEVRDFIKYNPVQNHYAKKITLYKAIKDERDLLFLKYQVQNDKLKILSIVTKEQFESMKYEVK